MTCAPAHAHHTTDLTPSALQVILADITHHLNTPSTSAGRTSSGRILHQLTAAAVQTIPGTDCAALTMRRHDVLVSQAPSDPRIGDIDQMQIDLAEGPSVDTITTGITIADTSATIVVHDFTDEPRWPRLSPAMAGHEIRSLLCLAIAPHGESPAALNLYSTRPHAFDEHSRTIAAIFAHPAAIAIHAATAVTGLERALHTRDTIGQAKGILVERLGLSSQQAFDLLTESSQHTNMKLSAVADWLLTEANNQNRVSRTRKK